MKRNHFFALLTICALLVCAGVATYLINKTPGDAARSEARSKLATTESQVFTDLQGEPFTFAAFEGKVRVVNSWASWSPFSVQELTDLEAVAKEYDDVAFVAVNRKEPKEVAQAFLSTIGTFEKVHFAIDLHDTYYASVEGYAMPETTFYDARGNLVFHKRGSLNSDELRTHIDEALNASR